MGPKKPPRSLLGPDQPRKPQPLLPLSDRPSLLGQPLSAEAAVPAGSGASPSALAFNPGPSLQAPEDTVDLTLCLSGGPLSPICEYWSLKLVDNFLSECVILRLDCRTYAPNNQGDSLLSLFTAADSAFNLAAESTVLAGVRAGHVLISTQMQPRLQNPLQCSHLMLPDMAAAGPGRLFVPWQLKQSP
ncbi:hypothetical protein A6R68_01679, partial [Neotoma lepida]